jgi:hypothetical protein
MKRKTIFVVGLIALSAMILASSLPAQDVLKPGQYTCTIKVIGCEQCVKLILKTLMGFKELSTLSLDQQTSSLRFTVKKDMTIRVSDIQKSLNDAASKMKMAGDYTLFDVKPR